MARNYTIAEATQIVREGVDKAALIDLGKKFPLTMLYIAKLDENGFAFASIMPEKVTMRKIEMILRGDVAEINDEDEKDVKPETEEVMPIDKMPEPKSWKSMSQYQKTKARALGAEYVAACKKLDENEANVVNEEPEKEEKKVSKRATKKAAVEDSEEDDFDFDDEEEVKPAKKEKKAKKEVKPAKKATKKVVEEEEDDDDFDDFDFDDDDE